MRRSETEITTRAVGYRDENTTLTGELHTAGPEPRPAILLVHGGAGLDGHARDQSRRYAAAGYTVLACDMYGEEVRGDRTKIMSLLSTFRADHDFLARRAESALDALARQPETSRIVAADPHVPLADVTAFIEEMDRAGADWQPNVYGGAVHGFTHQHATPGETPGVAYQREAEQRSFADARRFLAGLSPDRPDEG